MLTNKARERLDEPLRTNCAGYIHCHAFTDVPHHNQAFVLATIGCDIKDEVVGPHHTHIEWGMGARPVRGDAPSPAEAPFPQTDLLEHFNDQSSQANGFFRRESSATSTFRRLTSTASIWPKYWRQE